jgi:Spy/CpxP family protein refolding chaperone
MQISRSMFRMAAAAGLLALGVSTPAFSEMKDMPMGDMSMMEHRDGHGPMMEMGNMDMMGDMMGMCIRHADKIGLTADQIAKMRPLHNEMQKKQARFKADLKIAEIDLKEIMEVKDFDLEKANAAVRKVGDIKTAHHLDMLKSMKDVRAVLTDEQFGKMQKMMPMMMGEKKPARKTMKKQK